MFFLFVCWIFCILGGWWWIWGCWFCLVVFCCGCFDCSVFFVEFWFVLWWMGFLLVILLLLFWYVYLIFKFFMLSLWFGILISIISLKMFVVFWCVICKFLFLSGFMCRLWILVVVLVSRWCNLCSVFCRLLCWGWIVVWWCWWRWGYSNCLICVLSRVIFRSWVVVLICCILMLFCSGYLIIFDCWCGCGSICGLVGCWWCRF